VRLIKGSHIVVRRQFDHDDGYIFQAPDRRVIFALPFAEDFTLIGTTDQNFVGDLSAPAPEAGEIMYLCDVANRHFRHKVMPDEVVWSFAGVRALYDDGANKPEDVTRDYELVFDEKEGAAPLLTIYGGKITTYRKLAEAAMMKIGGVLETRPSWTATSRLPGGEFPADGFDGLVGEFVERWPFLSEPNARRLARAYGRRAERFLKGARSMDDLGPCFAGSLSGAEVRYLVESEWAQNSEDVLWRRSKLGLKTSPEDRTELDRFIAALNIQHYRVRSET